MLIFFYAAYHFGTALHEPVPSACQIWYGDILSHYLLFTNNSTEATSEFYKL